MKAILKYKIKLTLPLFIIGAIVLVISSVMILQRETVFPFNNYYETFFTNNLVNSMEVIQIVYAIIAVITGIVVTGEYRNKDVENFLSALPCKKSSRLVISIMPGIVFFIGSCLILMAVSAISYSIHFNYYSEINMLSHIYEELCKADSLGNGWMYIIQNTLTWLMIYMITVFVGVISRNIIVAGVVLLGIAVMPTYIPGVINNIMWETCFAEIPFYEEITHIGGISYAFSEVSVIDAYDLSYVYYAYMIERAVFSGVMFVFFVVITYIVVLKTDRTYGKLVAGRFMERLLIVMAGLYGAFILPMFRAGIMDIEMIVFLSVFIFVVLEFVLFRFVSSSGKYDYLNAGGHKK